MASWSDGTIQPPAAEAIPLAAAPTVAPPAAAGPAAAGPIIGARNAKMPETASAESVTMLLIAFCRLHREPGRHALARGRSAGRSAGLGSGCHGKLTGNPVR